MKKHLLQFKNKYPVVVLFSLIAASAGAADLATQTYPAADHSQECAAGVAFNTQLADAFRNANTARDPVIEAFRLYKMGRFPVPPVNVAKQIKLACIQGSLAREANEPGYSCSSDIGRPVPTSHPCITNEMAEYMQFAIRMAMECLSVGDEPLDPRVTLQKFNNESAFHFYLSSDMGRGIGQLTSSGAGQIVKELDSSQNFILDRVYYNPSPACAPFKKIVEEDVVQQKARLPRDPNSTCYWIAPERGLARNILYSLALYTFYRQIIRMPAWGGSPRVSGEGLQYSALIAFGPGGPRAGGHVAGRVPQTLEEVRQYSGSGYLNATLNHYNELFRSNLIPDPTIKYDNRANDCVEPIVATPARIPLAGNVAPATASPADYRYAGSLVRSGLYLPPVGPASGPMPASAAGVGNVPVNSRATENGRVQGGH